jgi:chaperone modulatory protein CbpM
MTVHVLDVDVIWLNDAEVCTLTELTELSGLTLAEVTELMESGAIEAREAAPPAPTTPTGTPDKRVVPVSTVTLVRAARRLRDDFELDLSGLSVAMNLLRRIHELERQLDAVYARHPRN